jgi:hypothetical protein
MWKNIVETNIMVGTHADSLIAEAELKNVSGLTTQEDRDLAWEAVWKDCNVPPAGDWEREYGDREEVGTLVSLWERYQASLTTFVFF